MGLSKASDIGVQRSKARRLRAPLANMLGMSVLIGGLAANAAASENVTFEVLGGDQCFMFSQLVPERKQGDNFVPLPLELVINNEEDYRELFSPRILRQSCAGANPSKLIPYVDFSKKTVLGLWSAASCAATDFERIVLRDDIDRSTTYSVSAITSPRVCSRPGLQSLNLVAVPKIPPGYKVYFENIPE